MQPHEQPHEDPFAEARGVPPKALAALMTCSEAIARWIAASHQRQGNRDRQRRGPVDGRPLSAADQQAHLDRARVNNSLDSDWLARARIDELAPAWRSAVTLHGAGDERARRAVPLIEDRLRKVAPTLMEFYDAERAGGLKPAHAMRTAGDRYVTTMAARSGARAHGARPEDTQRPPSAAVGSRQAFDDALADELTRLGRGVDPRILAQMQAQWRQEGRSAPADAAELLGRYATKLAADTGMPAAAAEHLRGYGRQGTRDGTVAYGQPDIIGTGAVDEHTAGLVRGHVRHTDGEHDLAAAARMGRQSGRAFPTSPGDGRSAPMAGSTARVPGRNVAPGQMPGPGRGLRG